MLNITKISRQIKSVYNFQIQASTNFYHFFLTKTRTILFCKHKTNRHLDIQLDGVAIERVNEIKLLGVIIDDEINWKSQIKRVKPKISRSIAVLNKPKLALDYKSLRLLYCSSVLPYLSFCAEVWGNNYISATYPLLMLQKKAMRIIHGAGYWAHTNPLFL